MADARIQKITSLDLPELAPYRSLKRSAEHAKLGIFVVEGDKVLHRLLDSEFTVVSVLLLESRLAEFEPKLRARPEKDIAVFVCERAVMDELVGFEIYQGVLALGKIPELRSLEKILVASPRPHFFAAMDGLSNAENIGVLMRNCVAFGVQALIAGETCSSPFLRRSVRNSMGAIFKLPVFEVGSSRGEDFGGRPQGPAQRAVSDRKRAAARSCAAPSATRWARSSSCLFSRWGHRAAKTLVAVRKDRRSEPSLPIKRWRRLCASCAHAACAASRRIRTRTKKFCHTRISPAIAASFSAARATASPRKYWPRAMKRWRFRWRTTWIRST